MTEDRKLKLVIAGGAVGAVLLALVGWFLLISPKLASASSLRGETADVKVQNEVLAQKVAKLKETNSHLSTLTDQLRAERNALPTVAGVDSYTRDLAQAAVANKVSLTSVSAAAPALATAGSAAVAPTSSDTASTTASTTTTTPATAPTAATGAAPGSLYQITLTVISDGVGPAQQRFLNAVEHGPRAALITSSAIAPGTEASVQAYTGQTTMTTVLEVFVAPQTPQAEALLQKQLGNATG